LRKFRQGVGVGYVEMGGNIPGTPFKYKKNHRYIVQSKGEAEKEQKGP